MFILPMAKAICRINICKTIPLLIFSTIYAFAIFNSVNKNVGMCKCNWKVKLILSLVELKKVTFFDIIAEYPEISVYIKAKNK